MWGVCVCAVLVVSKQEALEMIHYKDINSSFVGFFFGGGRVFFFSPSLQSPILITQLFGGRYSEWHPADIML